MKIVKSILAAGLIAGLATACTGHRTDEAPVADGDTIRDGIRYNNPNINRMPENQLPLQQPQPEEETPESEADRIQLQ